MNNKQKNELILAVTINEKRKIGEALLETASPGLGEAVVAQIFLYCDAYKEEFPLTFEVYGERYFAGMVADAVAKLVSDEVDAEKILTREFCDVVLKTCLRSAIFSMNGEDVEKNVQKFLQIFTNERVFSYLMGKIPAFRALEESFSEEARKGFAKARKWDTARNVMLGIRTLGISAIANVSVKKSVEELIENPYFAEQIKIMTMINKMKAQADS